MPKCAHLSNSRKRSHLHKTNIDYADRPIDDPSITVLSLSLSFPSFYSPFLLISTVPLTIPVPYKGTQFRRAELFQSLSERHSVPFIVHIHTRCIVAFTARPFLPLPPFLPPPPPRYLPPSLLPLFPNPGRPPRSPSVIVTEAHWTSLYNAGYRARVVDATLDCRRGTTRPLQCIPACLCVRCVRFPHENAIGGRLFVDAFDAEPARRLLYSRKRVSIADDSRYRFGSGMNRTDWNVEICHLHMKFIYVTQE